MTHRARTAVRSFRTALFFRTGGGLLIAFVLVIATALLPSAASAAPRAGSAFVARDGTHLELDGRPFRFAGVNMYWTGLDENVGGVDPSTPGTVDYPSFFRIRDGLVTAKAMGSTVIRAHTVGVSTGSPKSLEPALGRFNDAAFATMDYTVAQAGRLGLRLVVPLTDNWQYYHGGRYDFLRWLGLSTANDGALFYTDPDARAAYQQYVRHLLNHVNVYTGLRYDQDPTIMTWELGNELNQMTTDWVQSNAQYVKKLAPNQLVAAGRQSGVDPAVLASSAVDISDSHYYPPTVAGIHADAAQVTAAGKVYLAGEYGSPQVTTDLLDAVAADSDVSGALVWSLFPHADHYGFVQHDDGFSLHYPGDTPAMRAEITALTAFAATMSGTPTPQIVGDPPLVTAITKREGINAISWRGTAGAAGYRVQRSVLNGGWKTISGADPVTDDDAPWLDLNTVPVRSAYRVLALDRNGATVATSGAVSAGAKSDVLVDPEADYYLASSHSAGLVRAPAPDGDQVAPAAGRTAQLTYQRPGLSAVTVRVGSQHRPQLLLEVSTDGTSGWRVVFPTVRRAGKGAYTLTLSTAPLRSGKQPPGAFRIRWVKGAAAVAVRSVSLTSTASSTASTAPGSFTLSTPSPGATEVSTQTGLSWTDAARAAYYSVTVSTHADLSDPIVSATGLTGTRYVPTAPWPAASTLYVLITATNGAGSTAVSGSPVSFTTRAAVPGVLVDDFDSYASDAELAAAYPANTGGDPISASLGPAGVDTGHSMLLSYGSGSNGYAGVIHTLPSAQDWSKTSGVRMWVEPGFDGQQLNVQFVANGSYWEHSVTLNGTDPRIVSIPFSAFAPPPWADPNATLDLSSVTQLSLYPSESGSTDTLAVDSISAYP